MRSASVAVAGYLDRFIPGAGDASVIAGWTLGPFGLIISTRALVAIATIVSLALIQVRGVGPGRLVQNSLTTITVVALVAFVAAGLMVAPSPPTAALVSQRAPATAWLIALVPVMFSYTGWNAAVYVAEEVRNPTRNVPLALAIGTASVVVLYLALNALYLRVVPRDELLGAIAVGEVAAGAAVRIGRGGDVRRRGDPDHPEQLEREDAGRSAHLFRDGARRRVLRRRRPACTRSIGRRRSRFSRRRCGARCWCCPGRSSSC